MAIARNIIVKCSDSAFEPVAGQQGVYRKELVYPGHFVKKGEDDEVEFELPVDEALLDHWVDVFQKMKEEGIEVPVPIEHTTDPLARRGTVVDLRKEMNKERGVNALFSYIKFRDPESEKLAQTTQVSLFSPPDFTSGKGTKFTRPIRHVALTDYPLIPGLRGFEKSIAASLSSDFGQVTTVADPLEDTEEVNQMSPIAELADRLGIEYPPDADDATITDMIEEAWNSEEADEDSEVDDSMGDMEEDPLADADGTDMGMSEFGEEEDPLADDTDMGVGNVEEDGQMAASNYAASVSPVIINQIAKSRRTQLDQLFRDKKLSPAARDRLITKYCSNRQVAYACSSSSKVLDDFDDVVLALSQNGQVFSTGSRTGGQFVPGDKSPLVADAEARAKNHKR